MSIHSIYIYQALTMPQALEIQQLAQQTKISALHEAYILVG